MSFFGRMGVGVAKADGRHQDGKFKLGPANAQRKQGDTALQAAKDHVDSAGDCAKAGDEQGADFHVGMAQQYASLGCKNHLMGGYVDATKAIAKKAELDAKYTKLSKDWSEWNAAHGGKGGGDNSPNHAQAESMVHEHYDMMSHHHGKFVDDYMKDDYNPTMKAHAEAEQAHGEAFNHAVAAHDAYSGGNEREGDAALTRALSSSKEAYAASGKATRTEINAGKREPK